jgi:D-alanine transaminase
MIDKTPAIYQGKLSDLDEVKISPFSRAYTFSDSIYEVIPYFRGRPLCFNQHVDRLKLSAKLMDIDVDFNLVINEILKLSECLINKDGYVYFQVSRGVDLIRSHLPQEDLVPERFGYVMTADLSSAPINAKLSEDIRWGKCNIKSTSLLGNILLMNDAKKEDCKEIVMHKNGILTEGGASNVFYFNHTGEVRTSALNENILPGITRDILIKALQKSSFKTRVGQCSIEDFAESPCIWLTSSTKGLLPLKRLIGTDYVLSDTNKDFIEIESIFKSAMQLHLEASQ